VIITTPLLWAICHSVDTIDIAYLCTKFDHRIASTAVLLLPFFLVSYFSFSRSSDMIGAPAIFNGSHDLTTPYMERFVVRRL